eukprot:2571443-Alexandrium_andersonii.AAC.1
MLHLPTRRCPRREGLFGGFRGDSDRLHAARCAARHGLLVRRLAGPRRPGEDVDDQVQPLHGAA